MKKTYEMENNKIGSAILYFRETYQISQSKLCKGLCSVATLSRVEAGERDIDSLLLETLLERLGKTPNHFELILTDIDYISYQNRVEINKQIENKNIDEAYRLLNEYESIADTKATVHKQFITVIKALLNEMEGGSVQKTIELLMEAISYTVPDFKTNEIADYYLSYTELNIIIDTMQRMIQAGMISQAHDVLHQVLQYFDTHNLMEENSRLYPKMAVMACRLFMQDQNYHKALELCCKGLDIIKGNRELDYRGELYLIKAQITEALFKKKNEWEEHIQECIKSYLQAYYVFDFIEEYTQVEYIRIHLQEEYKWECTV